MTRKQTPADGFCDSDGGRVEPEVERHRTRLFFNLVAPAFHVIDRRLLPEYRQALETLNLDPGLSILDLATGTGTLADLAAEAGLIVEREERTSSMGACWLLARGG
jgi:hypothetical protein